MAVFEGLMLESPWAHLNDIGRHWYMFPLRLTRFWFCHKIESTRCGMVNPENHYQIYLEKEFLWH